MELFEARDHYIVQNGEHSLWCSRFDGSLVAKTGHDLCQAWNPVCLGLIEGVIGKIKILPDSDWKLLLIRQKKLVDTLPRDHEVYRITRIAILPLSLSEPGLELDLCKKHHFGMRRREKINTQGDPQQKALSKTWNQIKSAAENVKPKKKEVKDREKLEKRVIEELHKMFTDSDAFYYSPTGDLTNCLQRQHAEGIDQSQAVWKRADNRFFWNRYMLQDLIMSNEPLADPWIIPIVQGFFQSQTCKISSIDGPGHFFAAPPTVPRAVSEYKIYIISRRSRQRAGTRYKRRGVDETGACANYVETEQIIEFRPHIVSFVQVRGSIPVFWSQSGYKYRPPPRLDRSEKESAVSFEKHFTEQIALYKKVVNVNLVDQSGRELVIGDAFLKHILKLDSEQLTYVSFDFHEYCRGMKFENVSILTANILSMLKDMRYCWVDPKGMICDQRGVFRVNCVDCLDRTNVVQTAIARIVMETQCRKLGLLLPEENLSAEASAAFQQLWANNGDAISRQYAGTVALKGDFTRTGERKFTGVMKDGMHSANRYFQNRFKDAYRQATIDLMLGNSVMEEIAALTSNKNSPEEDSSWLQEKEEYVRVLIEECRKMLLSEQEQYMGGWALIDCATSDSDQQDVDTILLLSDKAYYIASYDDEIEKVTQYQKITFKDLLKIEIGPEPAVFKSSYQCIRIHYSYNGEVGYFHTLRSPSTRLFNNLVILVSNQDEAKESLKAIASTFVASVKLSGIESLQVKEMKLERKKSRSHCNITDINSQVQSTALSSIIVPRNSSNVSLRSEGSSHLLALGNKVSNVGKTLASLNPMKKVTKLKVPKLSKVLLKKDSQTSSTETEEDGEVVENPEAHFVADDKYEQSSAVQFSIDSDESDEKKLTSSTEEVEFGLQDDEDEKDDEYLVLQSCGLLATSPKQLIHARHHSQGSNENLEFVDDHFSQSEDSHQQKCENQDGGLSDNETAIDHHRSGRKSERLTHPAMKMSFSEGSLSTAYTETTPGLVVSHSDTCTQDDTDGASTFSKFKAKVTNIAVPNILSSPRLRNKNTLATIAEKKLELSAEKYKNYKTRVIEL